ncbi:hypothetical protein [Neobacillus vireti]|uniref:Uncharacterized protein n=1 Tax=Neobacillus vireti LMG 21834 TaxID=1131730 RepID=A0AB94IR83_9BACI|nr:hypothetical protein [Neobacillus vireti]ETI69507.1 hypothetical protein BAVI_07129 [Neobacillus vireti LMG 21834]KLT18232.1 hypothetical protein AA980_07780 [Neobacillus vireti]
MEYQTIFYGGLAGAFLSLMISIFLFIKLNISEVIEDLTGFSFNKWIKKLKGRGRSKREQSVKPITREIQPRRDVEMEVAITIGRVDATELLAAVADDDETELLASADADPPGLLAAAPDTDETELLAAAPDTDETELLAAAPGTDETELLADDAAATELLSIENDETVLLDVATEETTVLTGPDSESEFIIERDVVIVHTNATIKGD